MIVKTPACFWWWSSNNQQGTSSSLVVVQQLSLRYQLAITVTDEKDQLHGNQQAAAALVDDEEMSVVDFIIHIKTENKNLAAKVSASGWDILEVQQSSSRYLPVRMPFSVENPGVFSCHHDRQVSLQILIFLITT